MKPGYVRGIYGGDEVVGMKLTGMKRGVDKRCDKK